jgi:putative transposase
MASATWPVHVDPTHLYFITTSAVQRAHIFRRDVIKRILIDGLNTGRILDQYELFAFVVMPNHVHLILRCLAEYTPGDVMREFKKATANLILRHYEAENNQAALAFCASSVKPGQDQQYTIWNDEYQAKNVFSPAFLCQKLDYIHNNPVQPQWHLAERPEAYLWSSARFYLAEGRALIPLSDARELLA